jgi:DNA topoisomerase-3
MTQDFPEGLQKWGQVDPIRLLDLDVPVVKSIPEDKKGLERNLIEEARRCAQLICFLDCDREGENISFEVIDTCRKGNRAIVARRARFSALIPQDIHRAMRSLTDPDKRTSDAVDARQEIDLRLGAAFTRFQTKSLARCFEETMDKMISWGPCQFATLGFVVDRAWQIETFVPEDFWGIHLSIAKGGAVAVFEWSRGRLFDRAACALLYELCMADPTAHVTSVQEREKRKWRPLPLNTVALQTLASRKLGISSDVAMTIAEELYNKGILSYPRTETENFKEVRASTASQRKHCLSAAHSSTAYPHASPARPLPSANPSPLPPNSLARSRCLPSRIDSPRSLAPSLAPSFAPSTLFSLIIPPRLQPRLRPRPAPCPSSSPSDSPLLPKLP